LSTEDYLEYLDDLNLTRDEKLKIINHVILVSGRLFDEYHN